MRAELSANINEKNMNYQTEYRYRKTVEFLAKRQGTLTTKVVLDIGRDNPLTEELNRAFPRWVIHNTTGDLDTTNWTTTLKKPADIIIFSHVIEHLMNPLMLVRELKESFMTPDSYLYIMLPQRPHRFWYHGHFHEIDEYRLRLLLCEAGLIVTDKESNIQWRGIRYYLKDPVSFLCCPWIRDAMYECRYVKAV